MENNRQTVEQNEHNRSVKKRIMFSKDDDYYFLTYNTLIFLTTLGCVDESNKLTDIRKLTYIIPFISNYKLLDIQVHYRNSTRQLTDEEKDLLRQAYMKSRLKNKVMTALLFSLERHGLISLEKNEKRKSIDVWINTQSIPENFLEPSLFGFEVEQSTVFRHLFPKIKSIKSETLLESLFTNKGVTVWGI